MINDRLNTFVISILKKKPLNRLPEELSDRKIFSDPLIGIAKGNDPLF